MNFLVTRTSIWDSEKPCEGAYKGNYKGEYKGETKEYKGWFIDINSLENLITFENKYGDIVIKKADFNETIKEIEIYDGCRE